MKRWPRPWLPATVLLATLLIAPRDASSQTEPAFPTAQPAPVIARVAFLEQRLHALEKRLKAFERVSVRARADGGYDMVANGATVLIARDGSVSVKAKSKAQPPSAAFEDPCDPPFSIDDKGIRIPKSQCTPPSAPCDPPFSIDAEGNRRVKPECL